MMLRETILSALLVTTIGVIFTDASPVCEGYEDFGTCGIENVHKDVMVMVDASLSIDLQKLRGALLDHVISLHCIHPSDTNFGLIVFNGNVRVEIPLASYNVTDWASRVDNLRGISRSCCTPIAEAFELAHTELQTNGRTGSLKISYMITDGEPWRNKGNGPYEQDNMSAQYYRFIQVPTSANLLKSISSLVMVGVPDVYGGMINFGYYTGNTNSDTTLFPIVEEDNIVTVDTIDTEELMTITSQMLCDLTPSPTTSPSHIPTTTPSAAPTHSPTTTPTTTPTYSPTHSPTMVPTTSPTYSPTHSPTMVPTVVPTATPTRPPSLAPTTTPTTSPTVHRYECTHPPKNTTGNHDVLFMVDISLSVSVEQLQDYIKYFVQNFPCGIGTGNNRYGMLFFNRKVYTKIPLGQYTIDEWMSLVEYFFNNHLNQRCCTAIPETFERAATIFRNTEDDDQERQKLAILISDNRVVQGFYGPYRRQRSWMTKNRYLYNIAPKKAHQLKSLGVRLVSVEIDTHHRDKIFGYRHFKGENRPENVCWKYNGSKRCYKPRDEWYPIVSQPFRDNYLKSSNNCSVTLEEFWNTM